MGTAKHRYRGFVVDCNIIIVFINPVYLPAAHNKDGSRI